MKELTMFYVILGVIAAYLLGSIPTAYIFGKVFKNIDIREHGSGNVGATNTFRTIGKIPALIVLLIDSAKGLLAVTVIPMFLEKMLTQPISSYSVNIFVLLGAAAITGHVWPVFLSFKGGKGVATTAGVMLGLSPVIFVTCFIVWLAAFLAWRYVSLASVITATALPVVTLIFSKDIFMIFFTSVICFVGVFKHRSNIKRLFQGTEKKLI